MTGDAVFVTQRDWWKPQAFFPAAAIRTPKWFPILRAPKLLKIAVTNSAFVWKCTIGVEIAQPNQLTKMHFAANLKPLRAFDSR
jgi:hypothetical protein